MTIAVIVGILALIVFVSFYGNDQVKKELEIKRGWRLRAHNGIYYYEEFRCVEWKAIEIKTIPSEESYGIDGIRIQPVEEWNALYPDWARNRRDEISARIKEALPNRKIIQ